METLKLVRDAQGPKRGGQMSIFARQGFIMLQYLLGGAALMLILPRVPPVTWVHITVGSLWFAISVVRLFAARCDNCGKRPTFGPLPHTPFHPRCRNCGFSYFRRPVRQHP
jgi:hypothetical protein